MPNPNFPNLIPDRETNSDLNPSIAYYAIMVTPNHSSVMYSKKIGQGDLTNLLHNQAYLLQNPNDETRAALKNVLSTTGFSFEQLEAYRSYLNSLLTPEIQKLLFSRQETALPDELKGVEVVRLGWHKTSSQVS